MKYPGYLLNPGDMFTVDPEMVMLATGLRNSQRKRDYVEEHPPPDAPKSFSAKPNEAVRTKEPQKVKNEAAKPVENEEAESSEEGT